MASWMVHLRIADILLDQIDGLEPQNFIVGNIAPDSGVPNADWSVFTPSTTISHFKTVGTKADPSAFADKYFRFSQQDQYSREQFSFYLGYLVHLLSDVLWVDRIYSPSKAAFAEEWAADPENFIWKLKEDWYDLDHKFLRDHPDFRAFHLYRESVGFLNRYMEEFSSDAFDNRRAYITDFYQNGKDNLDRVYPYLTQTQMDLFVKESASIILSELQTKYLLKPLILI